MSRNLYKLSKIQSLCLNNIHMYVSATNFSVESLKKVFRLILRIIISLNFYFIVNYWFTN